MAQHHRSGRFIQRTATGTRKEREQARAVKRVLDRRSHEVVGWLYRWNTGDLAVMEPDRYVKILDRSKDVIISGGENISSIEVEDALYRHPAVMACAVVAKPDAKWGETPLAYVELKPGSSADAAALIAHCKQLLASYKVPREIRVVDAFPRNASGKVLKKDLRTDG